MLNKIIKSCKSVFRAIPYWKIMVSSDQHLEESFFLRIKMSNNTQKSTRQGRLEELDNILNSYLLPLKGQTIRAMDVGASSGITTLDWYDTLKKMDFKLEMTAGDAFIDAYQVKVVPQFFEFILDEKSNLIEYNLGGLVFQGLLMYCPLSLLFYPLAWLGLQWSKKQVNTTSSSDRAAVETIQLVHSAFEKRQELQFVKDNIIEDERFEGELDCLRACNIINLAYFDEATLHKIVRNLKNRLKENGLFLIARSHASGEHHGSIFRLIDGELTLIKDIGKGSEIKPFIIQENYTSVG